MNCKSVKDRRAASDLWYLPGCHRHAFAADSLLSLVFQIVRGNFPPISSTDYSKHLSNLVTMLLNRDVTQRPSLAQVRSNHPIRG